MNLPDNLLLDKIVPKNLYYDKKSREKGTTVVKSKYKLAGNSLSDLGMYFFYVFTGNCPFGKLRFIFVVKQSEWEDKVPGPYLHKPMSYCDLRKYELLDPSILLKKLRDKNNGFPYIARLSQEKYKELLKIQGKIHKHPLISGETKSIIKRGMAETIDEITSKLGLE